MKHGSEGLFHMSFLSDCVFQGVCDKISKSGQVSEWSMVQSWKDCVVHATVSSNLTLSARFFETRNSAYCSFESQIPVWGNF